MRVKSKFMAKHHNAVQSAKHDKEHFIGSLCMDRSTGCKSTNKTRTVCEGVLKITSKQSLQVRIIKDKTGNVWTKPAAEKQ